MDAELLQGFLAQAESYLPTIRSGILVSSQTGNIYGELNVALRQIVSIKDSAAIVDLPEAAVAAGELESQLAVFAQMKIAPTDEQSRQMLDKLIELEAIFAGVRFNTADFSAHVTDFVDESFENLGFSKPAGSRDAVEETVVEEGFEIDAEMMEIFAEEAEELVQSISANLEILEQSPNNREALLEIRRNAHTLKGSAGIVGLKNLSEVAHRVEDLLDYIADHNIETSEKVFRILTAAADCFGALASGDASPQLTRKISGLYEDLAAQTAAFQTPENTPAAPPEVSFAEAAKPVTAALPQVSAANTESDHAASFGSAEHAFGNRSIVRVSLDKLDEMVKIVSGLVVSRSVFEQRLAELEQQIGELDNSTRRLRQSTVKIETDFEADMLSASRFQMAATAQSYLSPAPAFGNPKAFDSLELDRYTDFHQTMRELIETTGDTSAINGELDNLRGNLETLFENQRHLIEEMQDKLLRLRMVSFGSLSVRLQRTARVTSDEEGKAAELVIEGENLEVDTQILDSLIEPLLHLLRNAVSHGIEPPEMRRLVGKPEAGKITVTAADEGTYFVLTVTDDGRGISAPALKEKAVSGGIISQAEADRMSDREAFALVFHAGLTTAAAISQISGRGVGMNIVKVAVERQHGSIAIDSEAHRGTTFTIRLPMALAVTRALLVKINQQSFALPLKFIKHITEISAVDLQKAQTMQSFQFGATKYKLLQLNESLNLPFTAARTERLPLLLIEIAGRNYATTVDDIIRPEEIVIKSLGNPLRNLPEILGATILGNGSVVPVLDFTNLFQETFRTAAPKSAPETAPADRAISESESENTPKKFLVLVVDDSPSVRHLTSNIVKNAGWTAIVAKDGLDALDVLQDLRELPDVILSDVEMPRMNGYELLTALKKQELWRTIPVVMITSRANDKHRQKAFDLGASEYLTKPFDDVKLIETVKTLTA